MFDPVTIRQCLDHLVDALLELRNALLHAEQAAAEQARAIQRAEIQALRDMAADAADGEPE